MALIRWQPFRELDEFDDMFSGFPTMMRGVSSWVPAADVYQDKDNVYVDMEAPGIDADKLSLTVENDVLMVEYKEEKKTEVDEKSYYRKEMRSRSFHRSIPLPAAVSGEDASATYTNGILKVTVPKREEVKPKTVKVQVKK